MGPDEPHEPAVQLRDHQCTGPPISLARNTGAKMVANYGTGRLKDNLGLFPVISSCGQFVIRATSCRVMMPDPAFYRQCLRELRGIAGGGHR
ncbi:MAG: hypothetical protein IPG64_27085 [Haliea sp.]|nr:hypothetical protein [Haliea sp.]